MWKSDFHTVAVLASLHPIVASAKSPLATWAAQHTQLRKLSICLATRCTVGTHGVAMTYLLGHVGAHEDSALDAEGTTNVVRDKNETLVVIVNALLASWKM